MKTIPEKSKIDNIINNIKLIESYPYSEANDLYKQIYTQLILSINVMKEKQLNKLNKYKSILNNISDPNPIIIEDYRNPLDMLDTKFETKL